MFRNAHIMTSRVVTHMYLKEDGKTVVMYTILGNATFRKHVVNISELEEVEEKYDFAK